MRDARRGGLVGVTEGFCKSGHVCLSLSIRDTRTAAPSGCAAEEQTLRNPTDGLKLPRGGR